MEKKLDFWPKPGIGPVGLMVALLVNLFAWAKLTGLVTWSWWWVFSPLWIWLLLVCVLSTIVILAVVLTSNAK